MTIALEWNELSRTEKIQSVQSKDRLLFGQARFATAMARESEENQSLKEKIQQSGFDFHLYSENETHHITISYANESSYNEVMKVSYTTPWPIHGRELTPEFILIDPDGYPNSWSLDLTKLMNDPEIGAACKKRFPHEEDKKLDPNSRANSFKYLRFIAAVTKKLGKPQNRKMFMNWQGMCNMRLYSYTEKEAYKLELIWSGKNIPAITASFTEPWPLCLDDLEHTILWAESEWEEKLRNIWTSTRRQYRARRPQIPNYDLEQRAKVYGLIEF